MTIKQLLKKSKLQLPRHARAGLAEVLISSLHADSEIEQA